MLWVVENWVELNNIRLVQNQVDLDRFDELADIGDWFLFDLFQGAEKTRLFMPADINISTGSFSKEFPDLKIFNGSFIKLLSYLSGPKIGQFC